MTIGEFLKKKRAEKKLSLRQLAYKVNLSHTNISDIEKGNIKKEESILKIIAALNLTNLEKEEALKLLINDTTPEELRDEVLNMKKGLIIQGNSNNGDIMVGSTKKTYTSIDEDLKGLDENEIQQVKTYIAFLKSQKLMKKQ
ncbi:helix-turn-helix domain-containing protein [Fusobacterium ulcerans]|uniref:helix-turn-helix domain-containing protein n=1 Tax=Fusobacterium ulcerans TaxID=861 RepID=UPI00241CB02B|nr:helix-turn-helix transcriptional regulator [Fusobacterium ulcerans]